MSEFHFEPHLSKASTLPSSWYQQPDFYARELRNLWPSTWQLVARQDQLAQDGCYVTVRVGFENVVVVNSDGVIKAFSAVCRHRAGAVASGCGKTTRLICQYHNWMYSLDGKLINAPEFNGVENFKKEDVALPPWQVGQWGPLIFVARQPLMSFAEFMGKIPGELEYFSPAHVVHAKTKDYPVRCNWKVYVDNYLEGYHLQAVHPELSRELDYGRYEVVTHKWYSSQQAPAKNTAQFYADGNTPGAHYFWLYPNLMLNIYQGLIQTNVVIPIDNESCVVRFEWYIKNGEMTSEKLDELVQFSDLIQEQDRLICESVQQNLASQDYSQGRYSVRRENGVHHFHGLLAETVHKK